MCCCCFFLSINEMFLKSDLEKTHINDTRQNQPPLTKITNIYEGKKEDNVAVLILFFSFSLFSCEYDPNH